MCSSGAGALLVSASLQGSLFQPMRREKREYRQIRKPVSCPQRIDDDVVATRADIQQEVDEVAGFTALAAFEHDDVVDVGIASTAPVQ